MFRSGMNNFPCQRPRLSGFRPVRICVPTSWLVVLAESFFACSLAQAIVPQSASPQGAIVMTLFPPGLFHVPSIEAGAAAWTAAAMTSSRSVPLVSRAAV
jgi:hypothetical protein